MKTGYYFTAFTDRVEKQNKTGYEYVRKVDKWESKQEREEAEEQKFRLKFKRKKHNTRFI